MQEPASPIRVDVSPDGVSATLSVPAGTPKAEVSAMLAQALLAERGVGITPERECAIRAAIVLYTPSAASHTSIIAKGTSARDATCGCRV